METETELETESETESESALVRESESESVLSLPSREKLLRVECGKIAGVATRC